MTIIIDDRVHDFTQEGMSDEIVAYAWRPNADGSITIEARINVYGPDDTQWGRADVKVRLPATDATSKTWARAARRETHHEQAEDDQ
jgi:hypothetical protein